MRAKLLFTSETQGDLDDAFAWYEKQRPGLGSEFLESVAACIDGVLGAPELYAVLEDDFRRALVHRFPYFVIYEYDRRLVTAYAVLHTSQDSSVWRHRVP